LWALLSAHRSHAEQIDQDIAIMKRAGFNVVRMGDLSWDSFEPSQGKFTFEWFDKIMDKMQANGIRVILDIPGTPAPIWLHRAYPGVDIVCSQNGTRLPPAERYMDDISDPDYVREVGIWPTMTKRYAHHPAVIAVGYDNEIGNGFMSYSEADRQRFIAWLKKKYGTIDELNKALGDAAMVTPAEQLSRMSTCRSQTGPGLRSAIWTCIAIGPM
jgi:beta-galactosidase